MTYLTWILRLLAALIMLQTLYFKFTGHEESVQLFTTLGMEPWGRIATGVFELIASILILYPRITGYGAALGLGLMSGAIFFSPDLVGTKSRRRLPSFYLRRHRILMLSFTLGNLSQPGPKYSS